MANILNNEKIMIGHTVEKEEGEKEDVNIEANIPAETKGEPIKIVEETMKENQ